MSQLTNSYPYPVLEEDRYDYLENMRYKVEQIEGSSDYITFEHKLEGDNLISQLLKSGEAKFVTTVVLKSALYRETFDRVEKVTHAYVKQRVPLKTTFETQSFISSVVYIGEDREIVLNANKMGLDEFWDNTKVELLKGSILATAGWRELENSASDLLTVKRDEEIKYGFDVEIDPKEGGRFIAKMNPKLYDSLNAMPDNDAHRRSIVIHVLCVGFMALQKYYNENGSDELTNFNGIKLELKSKNMPTWEEEGFNPNRVACMFLEHKILVKGEDDE